MTYPEITTSTPSKDGVEVLVPGLNSEFVTHRQWDDCARRIERKNLASHGNSLTYASIARRANSYVLDIRNDRGGMIVKKGWREVMKAELQP